VGSGDIKMMSEEFLEENIYLHHSPSHYLEILINFIEKLNMRMETIINPYHTTKEFETIKSTTSDKEEYKLCISHFLATH